MAEAAPNITEQRRLLGLGALRAGLIWRGTVVARACKEIQRTHTFHLLGRGLGLTLGCPRCAGDGLDG